MDIKLHFPDWSLTDTEGARPEWDYEPCSRYDNNTYTDDHPYPDCIGKITENLFLGAGSSILKPNNFDYFKKWIEDNNIKLTANNLVFKKAGIGKELSMKTVIGAKKEIGLDACKFKRQIINKYETLPYGYMK